MTEKFDPLAHHILVLERKNTSIQFRDLMTYQRWVTAQDEAFLKELKEARRSDPSEVKS
jgi:hypothetical protein